MCQHRTISWADYTYLRLTGRVVVVRGLSRDLLEHLVEAHVDRRVVLDKILEVLDDRRKSGIPAYGMFDVSDLLVQPLLQDVVVAW